MAAQSVPPLRKFSGEDTDSNEGRIDRWIEQFEERAKVMGWNDKQLFQLKAHLEKTAEHAKVAVVLLQQIIYAWPSIIIGLHNSFILK